MPPHLLVIGCVSLDTLHFAGQTANDVPGGAGLYTALAAQKAGAEVTLLAPRPDPMPEALRPVAERLRWLGPSIPLAELPHLEVEHHGQGRATLHKLCWGAEAQLNPAALPQDLTAFGAIHIAALSSTQRQLDFLAAGRAQSQALLSAGTYSKPAYEETALVQQLQREADIFFLNKNEAAGVYGPALKFTPQPKPLVFITLGKGGASIVEPMKHTHVFGELARVLDPTGAGDTFCGTVLTHLLGGATPLAAAEAGVQQSARMIEAVGPTRLLA